MSEQPQVVNGGDRGPTVEREAFPLDVIFVGGGPAGLAGAIRLAQRVRHHNESGEGDPIEAEIAVLEKSEEFGLHGLSGAVLDASALRDLLPDYRERGCPLSREVREDGMLLLGTKAAIRVPRFLLPRTLHNRMRPQYPPG